MGDLDVRVREVVDKAEADIALLANERVAARDYVAANSLLALAQGVADLGKDWLARKAHPNVATQLPAAASLPLPQNARSDIALRKNRDRKYPRFKREGDVLVKIGWSKSDNATYEHRSPRLILDHLIAGVKAIAVPNQLFTTEKLMPLRTADGNELPSYQSYLCLNWLIDVGAVRKHGRQGYSISSLDELDRRVTKSWAELSVR
jgi:hypothetical protein